MPGSTPALRADSLRGPVACVDLETSGGLAAHHRIIEVGIVLLEAGEVVEEWSTLVQPGLPIPASIAAFTGIDDAMVVDAPCFGDVSEEVRRRLEGRLFVAHNARFDYGFLRSEFRRLGVRFAAPVLCTVRLSRSLYAEHPRHNLDTLIERFGLTCTARHRALGDAQVLPALLAAMERDRGAPTVHDAVTEAMREARLPAHLPPELADDLPEGPGVYLLRDETGALLYVGKGRNLRSRVFEHFAGGQRSGKAASIARDTRQVEWIETGGELGALLLESRLLKQHAPPGNRRLRPHAEGCVVRLEHDGTGLVPRVVAPASASSHARCTTRGCNWRWPRSSSGHGLSRAPSACASRRPADRACRSTCWTAGVTWGPHAMRAKSRKCCSVQMPQTRASMPTATASSVARWRRRGRAT